MQNAHQEHDQHHTHDDHYVHTLPPSPEFGPTHRPPPPSGVEPDDGKKTHCSFWVRTGECDYTQQGCLYKHEMPDLGGLKKIGFRDFPRWWKEKMRVEEKRRERVAIANGDWREARNIAQRAPLGQSGSKFLLQAARGGQPGSTFQQIRQSRPALYSGTKPIGPPSSAAAAAATASAAGKYKAPGARDVRLEDDARSVVSEALIEFEPLVPIASRPDRSSSSNSAASSNATRAPASHRSSISTVDARSGTPPTAGKTGSNNPLVLTSPPKFNHPPRFQHTASPQPANVKAAEVKAVAVAVQVVELKAKPAPRAPSVGASKAWSRSGSKDPHVHPRNKGPGSVSSADGNETADPGSATATWVAGSKGSGSRRRHRGGVRRNGGAKGDAPTAGGAKEV